MSKVTARMSLVLHKFSEQQPQQEWNPLPTSSGPTCPIKCQYLLTLKQAKDIINTSQIAFISYALRHLAYSSIHYTYETGMNVRFVTDENIPINFISSPICIDRETKTITVCVHYAGSVCPSHFMTETKKDNIIAPSEIIIENIYTQRNAFGIT